MGDILGYGSLLLMKPADTVITETEEEFKPLSPDAYAAETVDIRDITFPTYEQVYGEISIPAAEILCPLVYGDTERALKKGAGQYIGSMIIGYGGTTMICAHVNRQFKNLHNVEVGDEIQISTAYGVYTYEVKYVGVHSATDKTVYDLAREDENVVLYTCYYQKTALGSVKKRFFVCADYVSGPMIVDRGNQA
ncbi:MAG: class D sortase [Oscillospiraceae bacterium]|nr:class D sortase [Oscillospiraceae bacterium]